MIIAIDDSPITDIQKSKHKVRGVGSYIRNLKDNLEENFPKDSFVFFQDKKDLPKGASVVHFPYFEPFFLSLPSVPRTPVVVTVHDLTPLVFPENFPAGLKGKLKWQIQKKHLKDSERIITDSEFSKKDITRLVDISEEKIDVVYLAASNKFKSVESKAEIERVKKRYNLPDDFLLYVGDVTWNKNLVRILHAVQRTRLPLVLCGSAVTENSIDNMNPWNQELVTVQNIIKTGEQFLPLGFVDEKDLPIIYSLSKMFVMPSLYEGFGLPILEAMKSGTPVVTSKESSIPEVAGDAAYYVDPYSDKSIADGIEKLWNNSTLRNHLKKKGFVQANKFSWKKTAEKTYESYTKAYSK